MQAVSDSSETPPPVPVQAVQQQLLGAMQKLVEWVEKLEMKPSCNPEQYMRTPKNFRVRGLEDEDSLSHATDVRERAIMFRDVQPQGTSVRAVEAEVYTRLNSI